MAARELWATQLVLLSYGRQLHDNGAPQQLEVMPVLERWKGKHEHVEQLTSAEHSSTEPHSSWNSAVPMFFSLSDRGWTSRRVVINIFVAWSKAQTAKELLRRRRPA